MVKVSVSRPNAQSSKWRRGGLDIEEGELPFIFLRPDGGHKRSKFNRRNFDGIKTKEQQRTDKILDRCLVSGFAFSINCLQLASW